MIAPPPQAGPAEIARNSRPLPYQIQPDHRVTFRLKVNSDAKAVVVQGDWPGGIQGRTTIEMVKDPQGFWVATTRDPLKSDVWSYNFAVDGVTVTPSFGQTDNPPSLLPANTFVIPGAYGDDSIPRGAPRGSVVYAHVPFMGATKDIEVYLPPGYYENPARLYPTLHITTGGAGQPSGPGESPQFVMFENLIAAGKITPMIVVSLMPSAPGGNSIGWADFSGAGNRTSDRYILAADAIATQVVSWIDHAFRTLPDRRHRAIGGFSSAGAQGFMAGARHTDIFANMFTFSGGFPTWPGVGVEIKSTLNPADYDGPDLNRVADPDKLGALIPGFNGAAKLDVVAMYVGTNEPLIQNHAVMRTFLNRLGIRFYDQQNTGQIHDGRNIRVILHDLVIRLFR